MKTLLNIFILLTTINCFSQDERLFEQVWYLEELIIDDISYIPPINDELPFLPAYFIEDNSLDTWICENEFIGVLEYFGINEFEFVYAEWVLGGCKNNSNDNYSILYEIFWADATTIPIVTYNIIDINDTRTLTINGANNNIAIYGTQILGVSNQDNELNSIKLIPTVAENKIKIILNESAIIKEIIIYNSVGQKISETKKNTRLLDVSVLSKGIYFLKIQTNTGLEIKRFIKK